MNKNKKNIPIILGILVLLLIVIGYILYGGFGNSKGSTYTVTVGKCENGMVKSDKLIYQEGDLVTLTIMPKGSYELETILIDGSDKTSDVTDGQLQVEIKADMDVSATFREVVTRDTLVTIPDTCNMRGMELTLVEEGKEPVKITVSDENTFNLLSVRYGTNYEVTGTVCGVPASLGNLIVKSECEEFDPSWLYNVSYDGTLDLAGGNFTYENISNQKIAVVAKEGSIKKGDAWIATKINLSPEDVVTLTQTEGAEASFGIGMTVGDRTEYVDIWMKNWEITAPPETVFGLKSELKQQNNIFLGAGLLTDYGKALAGDGVYYVLHYNAEDGLIESYLGETMDTVTKICDWGTSKQNNAAYFETDSALYAFTIGSNRGWGSTPVMVNFSNVRYGATLGEALGILDKTGSVNAELVGIKHGVSSTKVPDGTKVTLTRDNFETVHTTVKNGKLVVKSIPYGSWTVNVDGYETTTITVGLDEKYSDKITIQHILFVDYLKEAGWNDYVDLTRQNIGIVTQESGQNMFIATNDTYDSVAISLNLSVKGLTEGRHGTFVKFGNEYVFIQLEPVNKGENYKISWNGFGGVAKWPPDKNNVNLKPEYWKEQVKALSAEQIAGLNDGSLYFTLLRKDNTIYAFVDGEYCNKVVLDDKYTDMKCQVGIYGTKMKKNMVRNFKIESGESYLAAHPNTGALDVNVTGHEYKGSGNTLTDGEKITLTLKEYGEEKTLELKGGKISLNSLEAGKWLISAEGYVPYEIIIPAGDTFSGDIVLEKALFTDYLGEANWNKCSADLTKQNYGVVAQESGSDLFMGSTASYDSVAISLNLSTEGLTKGRHGVFVQFDNEYVFIGLEPQNDGESYKICWNGSNKVEQWPPEYKNNKNLNLDNWKEQVKSLSEEQIAGLNDGSLYFTLVRKDNVIYAFVDSQYCNEIVLDEKYADKKCQVGIYGQSISEGMTRNFKIEDGADYFGTIDAKIEGYKDGVAGNTISDGEKVTLTSKVGGKKKTAIIANGKITLSGLETGVWTIKVDKYVPYEVTIPAGDTLTDDIVLEYSLFTDYLNEANFNNYAADLTKQKDGVITQKTGSEMFIGSNDTYDSVAISLNLSLEGLTSGRHGMFVKFGNEYVFIQLEAKNGGGYKICWDGSPKVQQWPPEYSENINLIKDNWTEQVKDLSAEQIAGFNDGSLYFTLVREENIIYAYVDGEYINKVTLDEKYADQKCQVGIYGINVNTGDMVRNFKIEDSANYFGAIDAKIEGHRYMVTGNTLSEGNKITLTLKGDGKQKTTDITNGKINLSGLEAGVWTVTADKYVPYEVTIPAGGVFSDDITLEYALFTDYYKEAGGNNHVDLTAQNYGIISQKSGDSMYVATNDTYDSVAISLNLSVEELTQGSRHGVFIKFGNGYVLTSLEAKSDGGYKISWNGSGLVQKWPPEYENNTNLILNNWTEQISHLSAEQIEGFNNGSIYFTLVRKDNTIYSFIDGEYYGKVTLDETYADTKCQVGIYGQMTNVDRVFNFKTENIDNYLGEIDAQIIGNKHDVADNALSDGDKVTLGLRGQNEKIIAEITNGKLSLKNLEPGVWMLEAENYIPYEVTIPAGGTYSDDIILEYDLFTDYFMAAGGDNYVDMTAQNDGVITQKSGESVCIATNETYDSVAISLNLSLEELSQGSRHGVFVKFGNEYVLIALEAKSDGGYKICWNGSGLVQQWPPEYTNNTNLILNNWTEQVSNLSAEQIAGFNDGSIYLTLVRKDNTIYAFVDDQYCNKVTLDTIDANAKCEVGIYGQKTNVDRKFNFKIESSENYLGAIDTEITGHRYNVKGNALSEGKEITFTLKGHNEKRTAVTTDGKISLSGLVAGVWTIEVEGYFPYEVSIPAGSTFSDGITLEYDLFTDYLSEGNHNGCSADLTKQNDGIITHKSGTEMFIGTKDTYNSVSVSLNLSLDGLTSGRHGIFVKFGNEYVSVQLEAKNGGGYKICWDGSPKVQQWPPEKTNNKNLILDNWSAQVDPLSAEQITGLNNGELYFTLVREGNVIYAYVDGNYCNKVTLDEKYAGQKCQVGLYGLNITSGDMVRNFKVESSTTGAVDAKISGHKYNTTGSSLTNGTEVTFTSKDNNEKRTAEITNGKISLEGLEAGVWTVSAEKHIPCEISIIACAAHTDDIILEYALFTDYLDEGSHNGCSSDLTRQNEGIITHKSGTEMFIGTNDTYGSVAVSLNLSLEGLTSGRHGVFVKFGNEYVFLQLEAKNGGGYKICWDGSTKVQQWPPEKTNNKNLIKDNWTAQFDPLSSEQINGLNNGSLYFTLVRDGNVIYAYVDGQYCNKVTLNEKYANMKCQVGLYGLNINSGDMVRNFKVEENYLY